MGQNEIVADFLKQKPENIATAMAIASGLHKLNQEAATVINQQVEGLAAKLQLTLKHPNTNYFSACSGFTFSVVGRDNRELWIRFEFEQKNFRDYFFGVLGGGKERPRRSAVEKFFKESLSDGDNPTQYWSWRKWSDVITQENLVESVFNGLFIKDVEAKLARLLPVVKELLDSDTVID